VLSLSSDIDHARESSVMIRSREKRNWRHRRATERYDRESEPLRVLVRILASDAARETFARQLAMQRQDRPEVTVQ